MPRPRLLRRLDSLWFAAAGWPRRLAALSCLLLAGLSALTTSRAPAAEPVTDVVVVARDLDAGAVLQSGDLRTVRWPRSHAPPTVLHSVVAALGRPVGAAMSRGEPLTPARLLDTAVSAGLRLGQVAVPVRLADAASASVFPAGSVVDLYASAAGDVLADGRPVTARTAVAERARVLATLRPADPSGTGAPVSLVVAVDRSSAQRLSAISAQSFLATLLPPS